MVSQRVIAQKLNLSQRTVSLCLAGSPRVAEHTRRRVLKAAEELGYRPNRSALSMRRGRFNAVALLQSTNQQFSYLPGGLLSGIQSGLATKQQHLVIASLPEDKVADEEKLPLVLREWLVDGFLVNYNYGFSSRFVHAIEQNRSPAIWINTKRPYACVYPDDRGAGRTLTEHLLKLGHKRIDFFSHRSWDDHFSVPDRFEGYQIAMESAGLQPRRQMAPRHITWDNADEGIQFVRRILQQPDRPTAFVVYEAFEAIRVLLAAMSLGMSVPRDLSVAGFHERALSHAGYPVTVLEIPEFEMGQTALAMLLKRIENANEVQPPVSEPFTRMSGQTVARPPAD